MWKVLFEEVWTRLQKLTDPTRLAEMLARALVDIVTAALVLGVFYLGWRLVSATLIKRLERHLDKTSVSFARTLLMFVVIAVASLVALNATGFDTGTLLASLGVAGLTIGFALRDTLSNIISGILIFLDRPFTIDDLVDIDGKYGRVDRISLRTTRIVTPDGKMLAVPNSEVMNKTVASFTNFPHLRLDIAVTIAVTEDIDRTRDILLALVADQEAFMATPPPTVVVTQLNDYNVALELRVWILNEREHIARRFALREAVFKALTSAGIDMPYQTISVLQPDIAPPSTTPKQTAA